MKEPVKALLNNKLFRAVIHKFPFVYPQDKLIKFDSFLNNVRKLGPERAREELRPYEQEVNISLPNKDFKFTLLQFIPITLINPPAAWDKYYKKLFTFNTEGKILVQYSFGIHFNPVSICQYALSIYDTYIQTGDENYRNLFFKQVNFLLGEGEESEKELKFPYRYDFFEILKGPWLSALAQAQAGSVLLRAFILTKDSKYLELAQKSFKVINPENKLVIQVNGYEWVEEYPTERPSCVINGLAWVIISFLELQKFFPEDSELSEKLKAYIRTYKENVSFYDLAAGQIRYSLMDEKKVNNSYLGFQCLQMLHIFYYTKDVFFFNKHIKWQTYFNHKEFVSSYLPINLLNRRLRDISNGF